MICELFFPENTVDMHIEDESYKNAAVCVKEWDLDNHESCRRDLSYLLDIYEASIESILLTIRRNDSYIPEVTCDEEALNMLLSRYKVSFDSNWEREKYKWKAIKVFQDNWDNEADDFHGMLKKALSETYNLLASTSRLPRKMILRYAELFPEDVREMFRNLFDESLSLSSRIKTFIKKANSFKLPERTVDGKSLQSYQDENAVTTYLWLRYPDKYFIYKYAEASLIADSLGCPLRIKKGLGTNNVRRSIALFNLIRGKMQEDTEINALLNGKIQSEPELYPDPEFVTLASDLGHFLSVEGKSKKGIKMSPSRGSDSSARSEDEPQLLDSIVDKPVYDFSSDPGKPFITEEVFNSYVELLRRKKNVILQGPPGVGKTFIASRIAFGVLGVKDEKRIKVIQFHQSYSYEDFVLGYKPSGNTFKLKPGIFYKLCEEVKRTGEAHVLIIDEINRGNMSKIFGELLMLIEKQYRGKDIDLPYSDEEYNKPFYVPENLYIIGMMNTADRSLAVIDYALRRRFGFIDLRPSFDLKAFKDYQKGLDNPHFDALIEIVKEINKELGNGFEIGHSFFCNLEKASCTVERLRSIVNYDILPTLREYWFDDEDKYKKCKERLDGILNE